MTDERLQEMIDGAAASYRVPKDPPLDAMWARIEREHFDASPTLGGAVTHAHADGSHLASRRGGLRRWLAPAAGIAATLLVGIGIGRYTAAGPGLPIVGDVSGGTASIERPSNVADPLQRTTSAYLDDAEMLLASLPKDSRGLDPSFVTNAREMLTRTRVLLDSPVASDPQLREVLEDLELVLAQAVRLRAASRAQDLTFIAEAMDERDMVPRLRTAAASLSHSDY
ncbi:MAG: hypothetical protein ACYC0B_11145 [Gemmatimonadaceae bacterium]